MRNPTPFSRRKLLTHTLAGAGAMPLLSVPGLASALAPRAPTPGTFSIPSPLPTGDIHDFDFFVGTWKSVNRRLKKRWVGSDEWDVFPNTVRCESRMGGVVNLDEVVFPTKGWSGMTVRTFDLEKRQWSLYWINSRQGVLFPPVVGGFKGDHGEFYGDDTDEGRPIKVVFKWTRKGPDLAHWEQAFSLDGRTWETNWFVEHTRVKGG
ncbi:hypothetical protein LY474_18750 [Myxococcus stipitatus]|uniref:hypothetical protein n=1 Tax=Myxococcus stipitatus TaxID=83455 RepID=UPI001F43B5DE|nr:hypothetical protein [Myxococcus stipitatus]MCE9669840.1 hypothetical protein [Myxococcus stipitatus]